MLTNLLKNKNCLKPSPQPDSLELKAMNTLSELSENELHVVGSSDCQIKKGVKSKLSYTENFNFSPWIESEKENLQQKTESFNKLSVRKIIQKNKRQLCSDVKMAKNQILNQQKHLEHISLFNEQLKCKLEKSSDPTENKQSLNTIEIETVKNKKKNVCQIIKSFLNLSTSIVYSHSFYRSKKLFEKTKNVSEGIESPNGLQNEKHKKRLSSKTINMHLNIQSKYKKRNCFEKGVSSRCKKVLPNMNSRTKSLSRKELGLTFETESSMKDRFYPSEYLSSNPLTRHLYTKYIDKNSNFQQSSLDKNLSKWRR